MTNEKTPDEELPPLSDMEKKILALEGKVLLLQNALLHLAHRETARGEPDLLKFEEHHTAFFAVLRRMERLDWRAFEETKCGGG